MADGRDLVNSVADTDLLVDTKITCSTRFAGVALVKRCYATDKLDSTARRNFAGSGAKFPKFGKGSVSTLGTCPEWP